MGWGGLGKKGLEINTREFAGLGSGNKCHRGMFCRERFTGAMAHGREKGGPAKRV